MKSTALLGRTLTSSTYGRPRGVFAERQGTRQLFAYAYFSHENTSSVFRCLPNRLRFCLCLQSSKVDPGIQSALQLVLYTSAFLHTDTSRETFYAKVANGQFLSDQPFMLCCHDSLLLRGWMPPTVALRGSPGAGRRRMDVCVRREASECHRYRGIAVRIKSWMCSSATLDISFVCRLLSHLVALEREIHPSES